MSEQRRVLVAVRDIVSNRIWTAEAGTHHVDLMITAERELGLGYMTNDGRIETGYIDPDTGRFLDRLQMSALVARQAPHSPAPNTEAPPFKLGMTGVFTIPLESVVLQPTAKSLDPDKVKLFADILANGGVFNDPITVMRVSFQNLKFILLDGSHRVAAAKLLGITAILAWEPPR